MKISKVVSSKSNLAILSLTVILSGVIWLQTKAYANDLNACSNTALNHFSNCGADYQNCKYLCSTTYSSPVEQWLCELVCRSGASNCFQTGSNQYESCAIPNNPLRSNPDGTADMLACEKARQDRDNCNLINSACYEAAGDDSSLQGECYSAFYECWTKSGIHKCE